MKNNINFILITIMAVVFLSGCPEVLKTELPQDLVISIGRHNPTGTTTLYGASGGNLSVPVLISDLAFLETTAAFSTTFTVSVDSDLTTTGDNTVITTLDVKSGSSQMITLDIPATVTAGNYTLFAGITASDTVQNNNVSSISIILGADQPNLTITSLTTPNWGFMTPEGTLAISYKITNSGFAEIAADTSFVLNFTVPLSAVVTELGKVTVNTSKTFYPQESISGTATIIMPTEVLMEADGSVTDLTTWSDTLTATADVDNVITESSDADNTRTVTINSASNKSDLRVSDIILPDDFNYFKPGDPLQLSVLLTNNGFAIGAGYQVTLFSDVNDDGVYDVADDVLYTWDTPSSVPYDLTGSNNTLYLNVPEGTVVPAGITTGSFNIGAIITGTMEEWDTNNNTRTEGPYLFTENWIDIEAKTITVTSGSSAADGSDVNVSVVIENVCDSNITDTFATEIYISSVSTFDTSVDTLLGTISVTDDIASSATVTVSGTFTIPESYNLQSISYIYCVVNSDSAFSENNTTNNITQESDGALIIVYDDEDVSRTYTVRINAERPKSTESVDCYLELYNDTDTNPIDDDDDGGTNAYSSISNTLSSGTYYVKVRGYGSSSQGAYSASVSLLNNSYDDYFGSALSSNTQDIYESDDSSSNPPANPVSLSFETPLNRYLDAGETDWFVFILP